MAAPVEMAMPASASGQGGGVVHAVADHDDLAARGLFAADERGLVLGQHFGVDIVDADLSGDGFGSLAAVAGHHHDLVDTELVQRARRLSPPCAGGHECR